ncbi:hypothetical protein BC629DRAFT_1446786 [Irpex lacteus]|nr:hypothetical protein BC629DRAFT_1446786 [Irpex lacteus]
MSVGRLSSVRMSAGDSLEYVVCQCLMRITKWRDISKDMKKIITKTEKFEHFCKEKNCSSSMPVLDKDNKVIVLKDITLLLDCLQSLRYEEELFQCVLVLLTTTTCNALCQYLIKIVKRILNLSSEFSQAEYFKRYDEHVCKSWEFKPFQ